MKKLIDGKIYILTDTGQLGCCKLCDLKDDKCWEHNLTECREHGFATYVWKEKEETNNNEQS